MRLHVLLPRCLTRAIVKRIFPLAPSEGSGGQYWEDGSGGISSRAVARVAGPVVLLFIPIQVIKLFANQVVAGTIDVFEKCGMCQVQGILLETQKDVLLIVVSSVIELLIVLVCDLTTAVTCPKTGRDIANNADACLDVQSTSAVGISRNVFCVSSVTSMSDKEIWGKNSEFFSFSRGMWKFRVIEGRCMLNGEFAYLKACVMRRLELNIACISYFGNPVAMNTTKTAAKLCRILAPIR